MFGLDPLSRPVAIAEMLLLLAFAAFVGWLLGRLVLNGRINALRASVAGKEAELDECRRSKTTQSGVNRSESPVADHNTPVAPIVLRSEAVTETPATYVPADPLLPAYSHDGTPGRSAGAVDSPGMDSPGTIPITDEVPMNPVVAERFTDSVSGRIDGPVEVSSILSPVVDPPMPSEVPMVGNSEAAVLNRIAARANEINFDRIGRATAAEADDLKDIIGIGPFLERKLHSLGIYTFRQVANFTKEDVDKVNSIIEFFPGRIERDNWVDQSKSFHEKKYGQRN
jgi:predicted flap endonuclease-1-like 5' DNA nuclease